jgi:DNA repair protein RadC
MDNPAPKAEKSTHLGHRQRLRERLVHRSGESLADYEVLEFLLFSANPRSDTKPTAKKLISSFGSLAGVFTASAAELAGKGGLSDTAIGAIKIVEEASGRLIKTRIENRDVLSNWQAVLDYCQRELGNAQTEEFHLLFLDKRNRLIAAEQQQHGTVDHTPVYIREVIKRTLELGATAIILVHNHPSGDPSPSQGDIKMTQEIIQASKPLNIEIHDHLIIGRSGHFSFRGEGLI